MKKKYVEGGDVDEGINSYQEPQKSVVTNEGPQKKQSFAEAFKEARASGDSTFTWNGKKYSTEMAKPAAKSADQPAVAASKRSISDVSKNTSDFFRRDNSNWNRFSSGGKVSSASKRADGIAQRGKTRA
jgi:hypothetical protein